MAGGGKQSMLDVILKQMKEDNRVTTVLSEIHACVILHLPQDQVIHCITLVSRLSPAVNDKRDVGSEWLPLYIVSMWLQSPSCSVL